MSEYYVVLGAKMSCSKGSNERKINLPISHGSYVKDKPILNKSDCTDKNIKYFGVCKGGCFKEEHTITVIGKDGKVTTGPKCEPLLEASEWLKTKDDTLVEGKPALTTESVIYCSRNGNIKFVTSGQED